jgi:DNA-nicking Smr family endonuclease
MSHNREMVSIAEMNPDTPTLDLHGLRVHEAEIAVDQFVDKMFLEKIRVIRVVHGKGSERLAQLIPPRIRQNIMVEAVFSSRNLHELGAVVYAVLKV